MQHPIQRLPTGFGSSDAWFLTRRFFHDATSSSPDSSGRDSASAAAAGGTTDAPKPAGRSGGNTTRKRASGKTRVIVCAQPADCSRLLAEIAWFAPSLAIAQLPDWETLPYDHLSPHQDLISERLAALHQLQQGQLDLLLVVASTAAHRLPPPSWLASRTFAFAQGQRIDEQALKSQLTLAGYEHVEQVLRPGEYTVRGGLIDLFPMGSPLPYRLDLFDDELEGIRTFDPDSQRSLYPVKEVNLLPGREFPLDEEARTAFRGRWRERFDGDPSRVTLYRDIGNGVAGSGIEYYLPLFFEQTATIFDYLPAESEIILHGDVQQQLQAFLDDARQRFAFLGNDAERPALRPDELFLDAEQFFIGTQAFPRFSIGVASAGAQDVQVADDAEKTAATDGRRFNARAVPTVAINRRLTEPASALKLLLDTPSPLDGVREKRLIVAESLGRRETLQELFAEAGLKLPAAENLQTAMALPDQVVLTVGPLQRGFRLLDGQLLVITESELFPGFVRQGKRGRHAQTTQVDTLIRDLSELKPGDPVVHEQHGIGRYMGLVTIDLGDGNTEFLHLCYANDATLYVPVSMLHLIGRYSGAAPENAPLHTLGSGQWDRARRKAAEKARDTAAELLDLYARRAAREGHAFPFDPASYAAFAEGFGFEETPDQLAAIHAVIHDLTAAKPMDRLVCGDVGFGKTEVALRAAYVAAATGRQVAVLTPTTLLAEQHFQTFNDRFSGFPINVAELSRFGTAKSTRNTLEGLESGKVDVVIGTHKLLSKDVKFRDLGLVIIDEEHRFGVRQKEQLKNLRAEIDVLTLTATPIPRTLAMSLEGIRDFSVIATAPQKRLAIRTFVRKETAGTIREAILRELKRGGQVYFLHNEVGTIENRRQALAELVPEARIQIAHGQMPERELEQVMRDFHQQRFNVLLCTTIIETGIDVPTANTIIMHRADRFGLAQLHQLRGRVGRSHHQAYAYLLIPDEDAITKDAEKRLEAIQMMEELGSGFYLSMHDLEIRGAGEVLGDSQSGEMQEVGFTLYTDMLQQAVEALKSGREPDLASTLARVPEIKLNAPALLPDDYCPDVHERLVLYKRLASAKDSIALGELREELVDRFGKLPEAAQTLIDSHRLRLMATDIGLAKIDASNEAVLLHFNPQPNTPPAQILGFAQSRKDTSFAGQDRLRIKAASKDITERVALLRGMLQALLPPVALASRDASKTGGAGATDAAPATPALSKRAQKKAAHKAGQKV
ncbi:MAG: transcription-repair coupling factor [Lautropia sp.]|nr:transcription-repair coupling factor [Lautropia sp.]